MVKKCHDFRIFPCVCCLNISLDDDYFYSLPHWNAFIVVFVLDFRKCLLYLWSLDRQEVMFSKKITFWKFSQPLHWQIIFRWRTSYTSRTKPTRRRRCYRWSSGSWRCSSLSLAGLSHSTSFGGLARWFIYTILYREENPCGVWRSSLFPGFESRAAPWTPPPPPPRPGPARRFNPF